MTVIESEPILPDTIKAERVRERGFVLLSPVYPFLSLTVTNLPMDAMEPTALSVQGAKDQLKVLEHAYGEIIAIAVSGTRNVIALALLRMIKTLRAAILLAEKEK